MDKQTYQQLDRMEGKINHLIDGVKLVMNLDTVEVLKGFYEEEIENKEGNLHHLNKDPKVKAFFDELIEEETDEENETEGKTTEKDEEYRQP